MILKYIIRNKVYFYCIHLLIFNFLGHIQIAQVPDRNEPDTLGELDYKYIFSLIKEIGYNGHIGLEYKPKTTTMEGLKWVKNFGENL